MKLSDIQDERAYFTGEILDIFNDFGVGCSRTTFVQMRKDGRIPKKYVSNGGIENGKVRINGKNLKKIIKKLVN